MNSSKLDTDTIKEILNQNILKKKRLRYQIEKDIRFNENKDASIDMLAAEYAKISTVVAHTRDMLAAEGELIEWQGEPE